MLRKNQKSKITAKEKSVPKKQNKRLQTILQVADYKLQTTQPKADHRQHTIPELMAPAGDWTMLTASVKAGANAVYFGIDKLNMRVKAKNFTLDELPSISKFCKDNNVKTYLTLNTIIFEEELAEIEEIRSNFERIFAI